MLSSNKLIFIIFYFVFFIKYDLTMIATTDIINNWKKEKILYVIVR